MDIINVHVTVNVRLGAWLSLLLYLLEFASSFMYLDHFCGPQHAEVEK